MGISTGDIGVDTVVVRSSLHGECPGWPLPLQGDCGMLGVVGVCGLVMVGEREITHYRKIRKIKLF